MDKILYFPTISIPQTSWLMSALFYWDKIGSIVPLEFLENPELLDKNMQKLVELELIEQVVPEYYLGSISNFEKEFLNFIDNSFVISSGLSNKKLRVSEKSDFIKTKKIHMGKLRQLGDKLERRGLAFRENDSWYSMESTTASYFMTYLATVLGTLTEYKPITDSYNELAHFLPTSEKEITREVLKEKLRTKVIEKVLPVPAFVDDPYDVYRFKDKHYDKLVNFRRYIEEFVLDLEITPEYQVEDRIKLFVDSSQNEIMGISSSMKSFKWKNLNFTTICALSSPALSFAGAIQGNGNLGIAGAVAATGLLGAIGAVTNSNSNQELKKYPLAYAAIIEREFR